MNINRRHFVRGATLATAAIGLGKTANATVAPPLQNSNAYDEDAPQLLVGDDIAVANTDKGKVRGFVLRGITTYLGIPYGADTSGKNRFMPPQEREPWEGIKPTVFYGNSAPQDIYGREPDNYYTFVDHWNYDEVSEDCLYLNLWTPATDNKKRPVLVWLHGGGFSRGNGIEQDGYHGENITRHGDIVYCSLNHRLGSIGFSDFSSAGGDKYKDSGNVGMLDIVSALKWINKNIENFGGDPNNVTIIGQSGGGSKVTTLAAMPAVSGLAHKGVPLSGSSISANEPAYTKKLGEYILKEAGLTSASIDKIQNIPWAEYLKIADKAAQKLEVNTPAGQPRRRRFGPIADGRNIPAGAFFSQSNGSPDMPMLFCTTFNEQSPSRTDATLEEITLDGVVEKLKGRHGDKTEAIVKAYAKNFPNLKPIDIWSFIRSSRQRVVEAANAKLKQKSPVYMAWFGWSSELFDKRMRAFHCSDISFWFLNTDLMLTHTGGGARPRKLATKMSDALLSFMRTGNPNASGLPKWPKYSEKKGPVMVLNDHCEIQNDPDREARKSFNA